MAENVYGEINNLKDISKINDLIRKEVKKAKTEEDLTKLHRQSGYLVTLSQSPNFKNKFGNLVSALKKKAEEEYTETSKLINKKAESLGLDKKYDLNWGEEG